MIYAISGGTPLSEARPGSKGLCPCCASPVIPKCGEIKVWHWAHVSGTDCDLWSEGETRWHRDWKNLFSPSQIEVAIHRDGQRHRADVVGSDGTIIEFQHSSISPLEIRAREQFYGSMIWVFDVTEPLASGRLDLRQRDGFLSFRWKHARLTIASARAPVYLDAGFRELLLLKKIYPSPPVGGWCIEVPMDAFLRTMRHEASA